MKNIPNGFTITTWLMGLVLGWFAIATILAELLTPKTQYFSKELAPPAMSWGESPKILWPRIASTRHTASLRARAQNSFESNLN